MRTSDRSTPRAARVACLVLAVLLSACAEPPPEVQSYRVVTGASDGSYHVAGRAVARLTRENQKGLGFYLENDASDGSTANIEAVSSGAAAFGIAQLDDVANALAGTDRWQGTGPQTELRAVFSIFTEAVTVVAGGDTTIERFADLAGRRVDLGPEGSGTRRSADTVLAASGLAAADFEAVTAPLDERLAQFMRGDIDVFFYTVSHPNTNIRFATYGQRGARFLAPPELDELLAGSNLYTRAVIPVAAYPNVLNATDVETVGVRAVLVTSASVPEAVVYGATRAVFENLKSLRAYDPVLREAVSVTLADEGDEVPLAFHEGALRYFTEAGLR